MSERVCACGSPTPAPTCISNYSKVLAQTEENYYASDTELDRRAREGVGVSTTVGGGEWLHFVNEHEYVSSERRQPRTATAQQ